MMQKTRGLRRLGIASLAAVMVLVTACSGSGGAGGSAAPDQKGTTPPAKVEEKGGKLIVGWTQSGDTLDPAATVSGASSEIFRNIFETLISRSKDGFEGTIAERWEASDDAKTWTFHLRKGLVFSSGNPVNADAVAFTFNRILDPATKAPSRAYLGGLQKVEKVDEYTVKFVLAQPNALLLDNLSINYFGIVDPKAVEEHGADFGRNPVGSGPWKLKERVTGDRTVLVPNEKYQGFASYSQNTGAPHLDELIYREIPQIETLMAALQSGEINFLMGIPGDKVDQLKANPSIKLISPKASISTVYLSFGMQPGAEGQPNTFKAPFDDIRLRQAVGYAVDTNLIIDKVIYGFGVRNATPMPTGNFGYDESLKQYGTDFNLQKANQLLEDAGWKMGADNVRAKDGKKLEISFWALSGTGMGDIAQVIQSQLAKVGIKANMTVLDVATYTSTIKGSDMQLELLSVGWSAPNIMTIMTTLGWGTGMYNNKDLSALLAKAQATPDDAQRKQLYGDAQKHMLQNTAMIPLFSPTNPVAHLDLVKDLVVMPNGGISFNDAFIRE